MREWCHTNIVKLPCGSFSDLAISFLNVSHRLLHMKAHMGPPMTVHLRRSDCVNLSQCHATFQFAICLTESYWLAHTLVILPVSRPPVQSPHLHSRIVFTYPLSLHLHTSLLPLFHYHTSFNTYMSPSLCPSQLDSHIPTSLLSLHFTLSFIVHTNQSYGLLCCDQ